MASSIGISAISKISWCILQPLVFPQKVVLCAKLEIRIKAIIEIKINIKISIETRTEINIEIKINMETRIKANLGA
jgi:hypothetical protein